MTELTAGLAAPLGAHYDGEGINFTLYSAHAERVELCLFDGQQREVQRRSLAWLFAGRQAGATLRLPGLRPV
jgi:pullulanase/glycogen debranching enzyme